MEASGSGVSGADQQPAAQPAGMQGSNASELLEGAMQQAPAPGQVIGLGPGPASSEDTDDDSMEGGSGQGASEGEGAEDESEEEFEDASSTMDEAEAGPSSSAPEDPVRGKAAGTVGCEHYRRRAKIIAPCCGQAYWCRHCHNTVCYEDEQDAKKRHMLDRKAVQEVVCGLCDTRQPKAAECCNCGVAFGRYVCLACSFYDDDLAKECFHCDDCGICRVGGRHNFFHCATCNCCYAISLKGSHVCIENSMRQNCPVCWEYLFDSIKPINILPCGHTIHQACLRSLTEHNTYTCPVCMKSIMSAANMERIWDGMDSMVAQTPMPQEYADMRVGILCNDCQARSNVVFHVLGHKCGSCGSYNTRRT